MTKTDLRLERKKQRWKENRLDILKAAEDVFVQKGYNLASMDDIAHGAQFSKATLYRYFNSKRDIFFEVILNSFEAVIMKVRKIQEEEGNAEHKLKEIIRFALRFFYQKKHISRMFLMEKFFMRTLLKLSPEKKGALSEQELGFLEGIRTKKENILKVIIEILEEGIKTGEFRKVNAHDAAHAFEAMLHGFYFTKFWYEKEYDIDTGIKLIREFFLKGIRREKKPE
ncbi:MAG: TetR/AcrR family transcriptional regulator [Candidatus Aminicenantes bacterium]